MPTTTLDAATLEKLVSAAVSAPSIHNTQPWRYRLDPDTATIEVHAATERALHTTDPLGRALHVSVGAAVFNLRVAVAHFGWDPVLRLLPRPGDPRFLASVRLAGPGRGSERYGPGLYDAIWRRHSSRHPYTGRQVPAEILAVLQEAAQAEGARLALPGRAETNRVLHLTAEAERRSASDPDRRGESRSWVREGASDGLPGRVLGPQDATGRLPVRDYSVLRPRDYQPAADFEQHPVIAVLSTPHDHCADWLRAGQALEHVLLAATAHGVQASLLYQAVEWPDLRWALRDVHDGVAEPQMLVRFGYGPEGSASPRRPVADVLGE